MLPRATPESVGIPSSAVHAFLDAVVRPGQELHSFMIVRHGKVAAEGWWKPFSAERRHLLWSLSKSFCSTACGLAAGEGKLSLDDPVAGFFPDLLPDEPSENLLKMKVRHLLSMAAGHAGEPAFNATGHPDPAWRKRFLAHPVPNEPGSNFLYNTPATYMVSAIVTKVTGERLLDYLRPRLLEPLGIEGATWEQSPEGIDVGGYGLRVRTEDIAKFGLLYLQDGVWEGRRLLPEGWVKEATRAHVSNALEGEDPSTAGDWGQGYGFQFWRCRHGFYRGDGAFGQFCVVMDSLDAVVAITACCDDLQAVLEAIWDHLVPSFADAPLPESSEADLLRARTENLALDVPQDRHPGLAGGTFRFEQPWQGFDHVSLAFSPKGDSMVWSGREGSLRIAAGRGGTRSSTHGVRERHAAGGWTGPSCYELQCWQLEETYSERFLFHFEDGFLRQEHRSRGWFGAGETEIVIARRA
jgi:CubicO group peptidase (beta-lactamase class C family)